jgi:hypothetical protein
LLRGAASGVLDQLPNLLVLLLQYNRFDCLASLGPLRRLRCLDKLAVHGCPLHQRLGRRSFRLSVLAITAPILRALNFTPVVRMHFAAPR